MLTRLESWKNNQTSEIETMRVSVRDTALNISQLKDSETAFKNSVKTKLTDANEQLKGDISRSRADLVTKKDHDASLKSVFAKLKSVEQNPPSKSDCAPLTLAFEKLTSSLNSQLERLCSNIDKALQPLADFTTITPSQAKRSASHVESLHIRSSGCTSIPSETSTSCIRQPSAHLGTSHDAAIQNTTRAPTIQPTPTVQPAPSIHIPATPTNVHGLSNGANENSRRRPSLNITEQHVTLNHNVTTAQQQPTSSSSQRTSAWESNGSSDGFREQRRRKGHFNLATRRHHKSFVLTGISIDSDLEGLQDFLEYDMNLRCKQVKFLLTSREDCKVAHIMVDDEQAEYITTNVYWPPGMSCRPWLQRHDYLRRFRHFDDSDTAN